MRSISEFYAKQTSDFIVPVGVIDHSTFSFSHVDLKYKFENDTKMFSLFPFKWAQKRILHSRKNKEKKATFLL